MQPDPLVIRSDAQLNVFSVWPLNPKKQDLFRSRSIWFWSYISIHRRTLWLTTQYFSGFFLLSNDFICCFWFEILTWEEESGKAISVVCDMGKGLSK